MRVLVCGGRGYRNQSHVWEVLDGIDAERRIDVVITGGAPGADRYAQVWAKMRERESITMLAHWSNLDHPDARIIQRPDGSAYDVLAGFRRNARMLDEGKPDLVLGFPGGSGTADMLTRARKARDEGAAIEVVEVPPRSPALKPLRRT